MFIDARTSSLVRKSRLIFASSDASFINCESAIQVIPQEYTGNRISEETLLKRFDTSPLWLLNQLDIFRNGA